MTWNGNIDGLCAGLKIQKCPIVTDPFRKSESPIVRDKLSVSAVKRVLDGTISSYLKATKMEYEIKGIKIRCDSKLEYAGIDYLFNILGAHDIQRCDFYIPYKLNGHDRKYVPDFSCLINGKRTIIECKTFVAKKRKPLSSKWNFYYDSIEEKQKVLKKYCKKNNYDFIWFTKNLHRKFYSSITNSH